MIIKNSEEEDDFINELKNVIENINTFNIPTRELLENIVQEYTNISNYLWNKFIKVTKCSKA